MKLTENKCGSAVSGNLMIIDPKERNTWRSVRHAASRNLEGGGAIDVGDFPAPAC